MSESSLPSEIEFNRPSKYKTIKRLGEGACGETVLLRDEEMGIDLVAKKFRPFFPEKDDPSFFNELKSRFRQEAKILFQTNHKNIVRVYNYYDYSEYNTSYIIMEFIDGVEISSYIEKNPIMTEFVFESILDGFSHLEKKNIVHRDIRPSNILVNKDSEPKIIDFGFGKSIDTSEFEGGKSVSLNWWCETPDDFDNSIYDIQTEIYFVGKIFQDSIKKSSLSDFRYKDIIEKMCKKNRGDRYATFSEISNIIKNKNFLDLEFSNNEISAYRNFSLNLREILAEIQTDSHYKDDTAKIVRDLEIFHQKVMLEETLPANNKLISLFLDGSFRFWKNNLFYTSNLKDFLKLLENCEQRKLGIIFANLFSSLDSIQRYEPEPTLDDEIPF